MNKLAIRLFWYLSILFQTVFSNAVFSQSPQNDGDFQVSASSYQSADVDLAQNGGLISFEVKGYVHYPSDLSQGPYPIVFMNHGQHQNCYAGEEASVRWPCLEGENRIPNHRGYDYLASSLASHGIIAVSIDANSINGRNLAINGLSNVSGARADLLEEHISRWHTFNNENSQEFGTLFNGKIDFEKLGFMGHSQGGMGILNFLFLKPAIKVEAVLMIAPSYDVTPAWKISDVNLGVINPYCDGDLYYNPGVRMYDDSRYVSANDNSYKHGFLFLGANHIYFNSIWTPGLFQAGTKDDWAVDDSHCGSSSNSRLTALQQQEVGKSISNAFFLKYLSNSHLYDDILSGEVSLDLYPMSTADEMKVSVHEPDSNRLDINRQLFLDHLSVNNLGGKVTSSGLAVFELCGISENEKCLQNEDINRQPHTNDRSNTLTTSMLKLVWSDNTSWYDNKIPSRYGDWSNFNVLQFRLAVDFVSNPNEAAPRFNIILTDNNGVSASVQVGQSEQAIYFPPGNVSFETPVDPIVDTTPEFLELPKLVLNTVRLSLAEFSGVDMSKIESVRYQFDVVDQGGIMISDISLVSDFPILDEAGLIEPIVSLIL